MNKSWAKSVSTALKKAQAKTLTVGDLVEALQNAPLDAQVFINDASGRTRLVSVAVFEATETISGGAVIDKRTFVELS